VSFILLFTSKAFHFPSSSFVTVVPTTRKNVHLSTHLLQRLTLEDYAENSIELPSNQYSEYLNRKQLRKYVKSCNIFQEFSAVETEIVVQTCHEVTLQPNEILFHKGDDGDGMFIVMSGCIEIILPDEGRNNEVVLATYEEGGLFGELSLLLREKRGATARATQVPTTLWKLAKQDFEQICRSNGKIQELGLEIITQDPKYVHYLANREIQSALLNCPIFRGLPVQDLERTAQSTKLVTYIDGEIILKQGDKGDAMYIIKSGSVVCKNDVTNTVVSEIGVGAYFGELALLFNNPRALTVQAKGGDVVLWKLTADDFFAAVQDASLSDKTLELLKKKYNVNSLWTTVQKASPEEIFDLIRNSSRPKKKNVTVHSVLSTLYAGMFILAYLPQFHPTLHNAVGSVQLFSPFDLSDATVLQYRICSFLAVLVSLLGLFRVAKNAPECRKNFFTAMFWANLSTWTFGDSNVGGAVDNYTFDLFSPLGTTCFMLSNLIAAFWSLRGIDESITGPMKGRGELPLVNNRFVAVFLNLVFFFVVYLQIDNVVWSIYDYAGFRENALPFYQMGYEHFGTVISFTFTGQLCFNALLATLLLEKKISEATGGILGMVLVVLPLLDQVASFHVDKSLPQYAASIPMLEWMGHYREAFHIVWIVDALLIAVIGNSFRRRIVQRMKQTS